jgi:methionyl-tRNA synthetase
LPEDVLAHFSGNPDPLRFYLSHEIPVGNDGDFSWKRIDELYDAVLRNKIGNLFNRVLVLLKKESGELVACGKDPLGGSWKAYRDAMDDFRLSDAIQHAVKLAVGANEHIDSVKVWSLPAAEKRVELANLAERLRHIALMLLPFVPGTAERMLAQLGCGVPSVLGNEAMWGGAKGWKAVGEPEILFEPLE